MGVWDNIKKMFSGWRSTNSSGFYVNSHTLYNTNTNSEYVGWAYACVNVISNRFSGLQWHLEDNKGKKISHTNAAFITTELLQYCAVSLKIYGECYFVKIEGAGGRLLGLEYVSKLDITPKITGKTLVGYIIGTQTYDVDKVLVIREINPYNSFRKIKKGYSPFLAVQSTVDAEASKEAWNAALIDNGAVPGLILEIPDKLSTDEQQRLQEKISDKYGSVKNKSKTMLLTGGMKANKDFILTQTDMDFINGIKWDMEKILAVFGVSKAMLGMGEGVNVGNVKAFEDIFARNVILPLAIKIQEQLTRYLFNNEATMYFDNIIPRDEEQIRQSYIMGAITRNEMRISLGYDPVVGGDVFYDGTSAVVENADNGKGMSKAIERAVKSVTKGTDEFYEKRWEKGIKRQDGFEKKYRIALNRIFLQQEKDIMDKMEKGKKTALPSLGNKYRQLYISLLNPILQDYMKEEGDIAIGEVASGLIFDVTTDDVKKIRKEQIIKMAEQVDSVTDEKIKEAIAKGVTQGLTPIEVRNSLKQVFTELSTSRLDTIVRTESVRSATISQQESWKQSEMVSGKERYTALDERTCEYCGSMHGKIVDIDNNFFDKGDVYGGSKGGLLKLSYDDTPGPALHPNCRCTLIPVLKDINDL